MGRIVNPEEAVLVPLVPVHGELSAEEMLRMIINQDGFIIRRSLGKLSELDSGMIAQSSGAFAQAISRVTGHMTRFTGGQNLYRVELPGGLTANNLIPAVGGGYRGMVRSAESAKVAAHVRLMPAIAGGGAAFAAGPLIATIALAVAGDMLTQDQTNKKLKAIENIVASLQQIKHAEERSIVVTAKREAEKVAGYLLDKAHLPVISNAPHAFGELAQLANLRIETLEHWQNVVQDYSSKDKTVNAAKLLEALVSKSDNPLQEFERQVVQTYEVLAIRARTVVLEKIAAEINNPNQSLPHVKKLLENEFSEIANMQSGLVGLLADLNTLQINDGSLRVNPFGKQTAGARVTFGRLAKALYTQPDVLPMFTRSGQLVLDMAETPSGLSILKPHAT